MQFVRTTSQTSGQEINAVKLDSNAPNLPSQIKIFKNGNPTVGQPMKLYKALK